MVANLTKSDALWTASVLIS